MKRPNHIILLKVWQLAKGVFNHIIFSSTQYKVLDIAPPQLQASHQWNDVTQPALVLRLVFTWPLANGATGSCRFSSDTLACELATAWGVIPKCVPVLVERRGFVLVVKKLYFAGRYHHRPSKCYRVVIRCAFLYRW